MLTPLNMERYGGSSLMSRTIGYPWGSRSGVTHNCRSHHLPCTHLVNLMRCRPTSPPRTCHLLYCIISSEFIILSCSHISSLIYHPQFLASAHCISGDERHCRCIQVGI